VSEGSDGLLKLNGNFSLDGQAVLADVNGGLSVSSSSGSLFQWLAAEGTIPIIGLLRPVMGPPPGGGDAVAAVPGRSIFQSVRALFERKKWDVRAIQLRDYAPSADGITITAELPERQAISVGYTSLTAEQFLRLSGYASTVRSKAEEKIQTVTMAKNRLRSM
jgi:hypothetical protein